MQENPDRNRFRGCLSALIFLAAFLLIGGGLAFWGWNILQDARASASWPTAEGVVKSSTVNHSTDAEGGVSYTPRIVYTYTVNGLTYENNTIKFGENSYSSRRKAEEIADSYPTGGQVTVSYDPNQPGRSVLEAGVSAGSFIIFGIGVLFIALALVLTPISYFLRNRG